ASSGRGSPRWTASLDRDGRHLFVGASARERHCSRREPCIDFSYMRLLQIGIATMTLGLGSVVLAQMSPPSGTPGTFNTQPGTQPGQAPGAFGINPAPGTQGTTPDLGAPGTQPGAGPGSPGTTSTLPGSTPPTGVLPGTTPTPGPPAPPPG